MEFYEWIYSILSYVRFNALFFIAHLLKPLHRSIKFAINEYFFICAACKDFSEITGRITNLIMRDSKRADNESIVPSIHQILVFCLKTSNPN